MYDIDKACEHFKTLLTQQLSRAKEISEIKEFLNFSQLDKIVIGVVGGDGIGPIITNAAVEVLKYILKGHQNIEFRDIEGLTIEHRAEVRKAIPDDVLAQLKQCHVIFKGPTTTPRKGDPYPNIESANVAMRKELDLFANVRPVREPSQNIDWIFYRENTEGAYALGSSGLEVDDVALDFCVATTEGCARIIEAAFEYAKNAGKSRVTAITKANVVKTTDGKFLSKFYEIAERYPGITADDWYIDIMTAKLIDQKRRQDFQVMVLPNLYGDILTDEAAEFQGGVGTAGSANIGKKYAMFEAIHGSAPRMIAEGRGQFADPSSMLRAGCMLLEHIGFAHESKRLAAALDASELTFTGRENGATSQQLVDFLLAKLDE